MEAKYIAQTHVAKEALYLQNFVGKIKEKFSKPLTINCNNQGAIARVRHGYRNTRGDRVTGSAGTGTVLDFDTPRHTVTRTRGTAGTHGYFIMG
jgi:hypothetical protein